VRLASDRDASAPVSAGAILESMDICTAASHLRLYLLILFQGRLNNRGHTACFVNCSHHSRFSARVTFTLYCSLCLTISPSVNPCPLLPGSFFRLRLCFQTSHLVQSSQSSELGTANRDDCPACADCSAHQRMLPISVSTQSLPLLTELNPSANTADQRPPLSTLVSSLWLPHLSCTLCWHWLRPPRLLCTLWCHRLRPSRLVCTLQITECPLRSATS
jgi:hypothetical protein